MEGLAAGTPSLEALPELGCRMNRLFIAGTFGIFLLSAPAVVAAQSTMDFRRCTTANFAGGVSFADGDQTGVFGGAFGWELTSRLNIETTAKWLVPEDGADAFAFLFTAQMPLRARGTFVPFVSGGMGVYSASFESGSSSIPEFYSQRMSGRSVERFTDPAFVLGGGASIFASRNVSIRPEVEIIWVTDDGSYFVTSAMVRVAYHFEKHRITPSVRPR